MFRFLCKTIIRHGRITITPAPINILYLLQTNSLNLSTKCVSSTSNQHSFTVSYLINFCGLSASAALTAAERVNFETPNKADTVLAFFRKHGFSETQITKVVRGCPSLLSSDIEKTLLPKLEFLYSKGASVPTVAKIISSYPLFLRSHLENTVIPCFNFFSDLLQSDEKTIAAFKRCPSLLRCSLKTYVLPSISVLRENGVPESNIIKLIQCHPRTVIARPDPLSLTVEEVKAMGFDPSKLIFLIAVVALRQMSKSTWERKVDVYKKLGWSEEEVYEAFRRQPACMMTSEEKIMKIMDFFVNRLGFKPSIIAKRPILIALSFEKRIVPRGEVLIALLARGLLTTDRVRLQALFESKEKSFLEKFVNCYEKEAPQLMKLYREKTHLGR